MNYCFLNGEIMPTSEAKVSVFDIGLLRGYGIYDGLTTIEGKPFRFIDHWKRFVGGAHALNLNIPITEEVCEKKITEIVKKSGLKDRAIIRVILTGGETLAGIEYDFEKPTFYITAEKWESLPAEIFEKGGKLVTYRHMREMPEHKTINYIAGAKLQNWRKEEKAVEILYTYDGEVLECATSNVFIIKNNTLITPVENVLEGITKKVILELADGKYKVEERPVLEEELKTADEVFICSSFKDVAPITRIDNFVVGDGEVGLITKDLMGQFAKILQMG